jgi:enterochelin esterase-like enzyme
LDLDLARHTKFRFSRDGAYVAVGICQLGGNAKPEVRVIRVSDGKRFDLAEVADRGAEQQLTQSFGGLAPPGKEPSMRAAAGVLALIGCLAGRLALCSAADPETWVHPPGKLPPGVQHKTFRSNSMKHDVGYNIYLPPEYARSDFRFPVVYLLHGGGGHESRHFFPSAAQTLDRAIKGKQVPPCICVFAMAGRTSMYGDSPDGKVMGETVVIKELIPHIDKTYRTIAAREGRALEGMSMGGFGALKFAFKYPNMFGSAVAYAPGLWQSPLGFQEEEVRKILKQNLNQIRGAVGLRIIIGEDDHLNMHGAKLTRKPEDHRFVENNRKLHALLNQLQVPHEYVELPKRGHDCNVLFRQVGLEGFRFQAGHFGWVPLFNGKDLTGWKIHGGTIDAWGVKAGLLYVAKPARSRPGGREQPFWLMTGKEYGNFELRLEFKVPPGGNSGVALRSPLTGDPAYQAMEIQILDDNARAYKNLPPDHYTGSIYGVAAPQKRVSKPAGEWNRFRIVCKGQEVTIELNGTQIIDANLESLKKEHGKKHPGLLNRKGHIGVQSHDGRVEFRNLFIKEQK